MVAGYGLRHWIEKPAHARNRRMRQPTVFLFAGTGDPVLLRMMVRIVVAARRIGQVRG